jgi:hypothetical protein
MLKSAIGLLVVAASILSLAGTTSAARETICNTAAVVFCDNFEDRALGNGSSASLATFVDAKNPGWDFSDDPNPMQVASDRGFPDGSGGTKSLKFTYPACTWTTNQNQNCGTGFMSNRIGLFSLNDLYVRHYALWQAGFTWSPIINKHIAYMNNGGAARSPWFLSDAAFPHGQSRFIIADEPRTDTIQNENLNPPAVVINTEQWYCIEVHLRNSGTKLFEGWIDGVKRWSIGANGPDGSAFLGTTPWVQVFPDGYWNTDGPPCTAPCSKPASAKWFDNIVVSTAPIGCLGAAPRAPSSPQGVNLTMLSVALAAVAVVLGGRRRARRTGR